MRSHYEQRVFREAKEELLNWARIIERKSYEDPHELRQDFPKVSFLGNDRTVVNICGNRFRLVVDVAYELQVVYVRELLTHDEYVRRSGTL